MDAVAALPARPRFLHADNSAGIERRPPGSTPYRSRAPGDLPVRRGQRARYAARTRAGRRDARPRRGSTRGAGGRYGRLRRHVACAARGTSRDGLARATPTGIAGASAIARIALVSGERVPVVGFVTMDMTMLDVTDHPCAVGDVVDVHRTGRRRAAQRGRRRSHGRVLPVRDPHGAAWTSAADLRRRRAVSRRAAIIVLDGVGIGEAPDAAQYGDAGSNTLGNIARAVGGMRLPNLERAGLGNIAPLAGRRAQARGRQPRTAALFRPPPARTARPATGRSRASTSPSRSRRTRTASRPTCWPSSRGARVAGCSATRRRAGRQSSLSSASEHQRTGAWIVYTSADSVFQVAAHEETVPLDELYRRVRGRAGRCSFRPTTCPA